MKGSSTWGTSCSVHSMRRVVGLQQASWRWLKWTSRCRQHGLLCHPGAEWVVMLEWRRLEGSENPPPPGVSRL
eukprot:1954563-Amphidinium_carterae.1